MENYIYNYVFIGPRPLRANSWGEAARVHDVFAVTTTDARCTRRASPRSCGAIEGVKTVAYNDETIETYRDHALRA